MNNITQSHFSFEVGQFFLVAGTVIQIVEFSGHQCVLALIKTGEQKPVPLEKLLSDYREGTLTPCSKEEALVAAEPGFDVDNSLRQKLGQPLDDLSLSTRENGLKKLRYIEALRALGYTSLRPTPILELDYKRLIQKFDDECPLKLSTIYNCDRQVQAANGDKRVAFPNFKDRGGKGHQRWSQKADSAYKKIAQDLEGKPNEKVNTKLMQRALQSALYKEEGPNLFAIMPSASSIERRNKAYFGEYELYRRQHGKAAANKKFRDWRARDIAIMPLEVVEFDDKDSRCFLWDSKNGLPNGRAYITAGVDQYSRVPLGFNISDRHRNVLSAKQTYLDAILPWDSSHPSYVGLRSSPEFYGQFGIALFDNAMYNHATELELFALDVSASTIFAWAKPRTPTEKSVIEDFNGRMVADHISNLPGFGGPKGLVDYLKDAQDCCCMEAHEFRNGLTKWAYDSYCNTSREGYTPRELWRHGMKNVTQRLPSKPHAALLASTLVVEKQLRPEGVQLLSGLSYQSPELLLLKRYLGANAKVKIRYNPYRLLDVYVEDPRTSTYLVVPSTTPGYTKNLTHYQHKLILKACAERGRNNPSISDLIVGLEELKLMVEQLRDSKKKRERAIARKASFDVATNIPGPQPYEPNNPVVELVSELEATVLELEVVELTHDEEDWSFTI